MNEAGQPASFAEFERFYRDYRPQLLRFVHQVGHSDGLSEAHLDAEGVVQETFEQCYLKGATIQHPQRWIYRVAARKVRQHSRQEWFQDRVLRQRLAAVCSVGSDGDPTHTHAVAGAIVDRIMELPTNQRIATYLRYVEQWTGPEIAELLDIAPATAYVHIHRGIGAVQRDLQAASERPQVSLAGYRREMSRIEYTFETPETFPSRMPRAMYRRVWAPVCLVAAVVALVLLYPWLLSWLGGARKAARPSNRGAPRQPEN